jgi:dihydrofolate synthase/folylpolyglutamate synthase
MIASVLRQAGYRIGLFTSPHLTHIEERIQVDGQSFGKEELAALMADVRPCVEKMDRRRPGGAVGVTFFEIATALGLLHFQRRRVDVAVLEVGLGGRFDSTNVCRPLVSVITSISFDHTQQLGNTLARIAMEKAGIVKPGRPVVSGVDVPEPREVIQAICRERGAPLRQVGVDFRYEYSPGIVGQREGGEVGGLPGARCSQPTVRVATARQRWPEMEIALLGRHQAANAAVVVATVEELRALGLTIEDRAVATGLKAVQWPARLELMCGRPLVVLDCAHNVASALALVDTLRESCPVQGGGNGNGRRGRRYLVFAGSGDKDLVGIFEVLSPHFDHAYLTRFTSNPRSVPPQQLLQMWQRVSRQPATAHQDPRAAWDAARTTATGRDLICVTGSVFLAGELRPLIMCSS